MEKLTLLERYWKLRLDFEASGKEVMPTPAQLWAYQELLYRIGVLEVCQMLSKAAPFSCEMKVLIPHYQAVNAYMENLRKERFLQSSDPETQKQQQTALGSLNSVIEDYRKRYASYAPKSPEQYQKDIGRTVATVLPAWVQYRNTITEIKIIEEAAS